MGPVVEGPPVVLNSYMEMRHTELYDLAGTDVESQMSMSMRHDFITPDMSKVMADPFAAFNLGLEQEAQYLSDAEIRLTNCDSWNVNATLEIRKLIGSVQKSPQIHASLEDMTRRMQQNMTNTVFPFRNLIWDMARTLWEALLHSRSGDNELVQECNQQLDAIVMQIAEVFKKQHGLLAEISTEHHMALINHAEAGECAEKQAMMRTEVSRFLWACGGLRLTTFCVGLAYPQVLVNAGLSRQWLGLEGAVSVMDDATGVKTELSPRIPASHAPAGLWMYTLIGTGLGSLFLGSLCYGLALLYRKKADKGHLFCQANSFQKLNAQQNQRMWEGMNMSVENLQASVAELRNVNTRRKDRRECIIHDIGWKLFGMSMAVDEYIMWLAERDYFPTNFSVRNALQPSRYDRIKSVFESITRTPGDKTASLSCSPHDSRPVYRGACPDAREGSCVSERPHRE